jgi:mono/diheme cytochrome c family protein
VLHGLAGPVKVAGRVFSVSAMPDHAALTDEDIAAILTYVRRGWQNRGDPIDPSFIGAIRQTESRREIPWTARELDAIR